MQNPAIIDPVDYLVIGHISRDLTPKGVRIGGTVSYAALTAQALGYKVGIVTAWGEDVPLGPLHDIPIAGIISDHSTTFANLETTLGRVQILHQLAPSIDYHLIPEAWRDAAIVHIGPIAQEISPTIIQHFSHSFIGVTAQGWLRDWGADGRIFACELPEAHYILEHSSAVVISAEDIGNNMKRANSIASYGQLLAVTQGADGVNIFYCGNQRQLVAPLSDEIDSVGAGDIFAAAFFIQFQKYQDPWKAARFANRLASASVSKIGLASATTEISKQLATKKA